MRLPGFVNDLEVNRWNDRFFRDLFGVTINGTIGAWLAFNYVVPKAIKS